MKSDSETAPDWISHPTITPGTTVLAAVDPHGMTPSERAFGRAPKLSPDVDYQPGVIVMEGGDKAIKSIASDGLTWTFDANAPHVNEFEVGKIVFATGRAVGKVLGLKRNGSTVSVYLGPVQLTDLIKRGRFVMDQPVDPDKIVSYVAPDYPAADDSAVATKTAMTDGARGGEETVVISTPSHGQWIPTSMSRRLADGRRMTYRRHGGRWYDANRATTSHFARAIHGVPAGMPNLAMMQSLGLPPTATVNLNSGDLRVDGVSNHTFLGVQYYYTPKNGVSAYAAGLITLQAPRVRCVFTLNSAGVDSAGIEIKGAGGVKLQITSHSPSEAFVNMHLQKWVPLDMSIQLGGPVPLSLTFAVLFNINSGFSAKASVMDASGEYGFSGGIWAGRAGGHWTIATPNDVHSVRNLGKSIGGLSMGITSFTMSFALRTSVGVGGFGFNAGVFAQVRFGGSLLNAASHTLPCRQATIQAFLDTGVGYQMPQWTANAINFFLGPIGVQKIDPVGTLLRGPATTLFTGFDQIPTGCSGSPG